MAEMTKFARGARYYLPWDAMQLSTEIDGGHRAFKNAVRFDMYQTYRRKVQWSPLIHDSFSFYSPDFDSFLSLVESCVKQARLRFPESVSFEHYSFTPNQRLQDLDDSSVHYHYHPFEGDLLELLTGLLTVRDEVRAKTQDAHLIEAPNKKLQVIVLSLNDDLIEDLYDPNLIELFVKTLQDFSRERIYMFVHFETFNSVPRKIRDAFTFGCVIGSNMFDELYEQYPEYTQVNRDKRRRAIGAYIHYGDYELRELYDLKFVPSKHQSDVQKARDEEERLYREFLETLSKQELS